MSTQNPLISVIIPVYNVGTFLQPCLNSLQAQTYKNLEILLIDDGSTDGSGELCDAYAEKDARFQAIHKENGGVSSARNLGLDMAQGEYIAFIDADDYVLPDYFEVLYNDLTEQQVDAAFCGYNYVDESGKELPCSYRRIQEPKRISSLNTLFCSIDYLGFAWALFTAKTIRGRRFSGMRYGEDLLFIYDWLCTNPSVSLTPYRGYFYVQRQSSALHNPKISLIEKTLGPLQLHFYAYSHLPVKTPDVNKIFLSRYAIAVHRAASAYALLESRCAKQEDLREHLSNILPHISQLPGKLRLYILLFAKAPWLYNLLTRVHGTLKK